MNTREDRRAERERKRIKRQKLRDEVEYAMGQVGDVTLGNADEKLPQVMAAMGKNEVGSGVMIATLILQIIVEILKARNAK